MTRAALALLVAFVAGAACAQVPRDAEKYRRDIVRNARLVWGLDAPVAVFAAQVQQESEFREDAKSYVGAQGLAQFMPTTATWIAGAYRDLDPPEPNNPAWALRALVTYDRHLWERTFAANECERAAKMLSSYNGGAGWVARDERAALAAGLDPLRWFDHVETVNAGRSASNWRENRGYPRRILRTLAPRYVAAGWGSTPC